MIKVLLIWTVGLSRIDARLRSTVEPFLWTARKDPEQIPFEASVVEVTHGVMWKGVISCFWAGEKVLRSSWLFLSACAWCFSFFSGSDDWIGFRCFRFFSRRIRRISWADCVVVVTNFIFLVPIGPFWTSEFSVHAIGTDNKFCTIFVAEIMISRWRTIERQRILFQCAYLEL